MCAARNAGSEHASANYPPEPGCPHQATRSPTRREFGGIHTPTMKQPLSMLIFPHQQAEKLPFQQHAVSYNPIFPHHHAEKPVQDQHVLSFNAKAPGRAARGFPGSGADDGNRTRVICLEGRGSTIELHPRTPEGDTKILAGIVHVRDIYTPLPYDGAADISPTGCSAAW